MRGFTFHCLACRKAWWASIGAEHCVFCGSDRIKPKEGS